LKPETICINATAYSDIQKDIGKVLHTSILEFARPIEQSFKKILCVSIYPSSSRFTVTIQAPILETGYAHRLLQFGYGLFLLGLLTGLGIPLLANPRMGLSSHLEGVMNGIFLIGLGLVCLI